MRHTNTYSGVLIGFSLLFCLLMLSECSASAHSNGSDDVNLLKDASFENLGEGPGGWETCGKVSMVPVTEGAKDGRVTCLLKPTGFGQGVRQTFSPIEDKNFLNSTICFGVWVRADKEPANMKMAILNSGSQNLFNNVATYYNISKEWQFFTVTARTGPSYTNLAVYIYPDDGRNGGSENDIYIDGATVVKKKLSLTNRLFTLIARVLDPGLPYSIIIAAIVVQVVSSVRFFMHSNGTDTSLSKHIVDTLKKITLPISVGLLLVVLSTADPPPIYQIYRFVPTTQPNAHRAVDLTSFYSAASGRSSNVAMSTQPPLAVDFTSFSSATILFLAVNYLIISLFGYLLAYRFFSRLGVCPIIEFIASFLVGYLCIIPLIRILSLVIQYEGIYLPVITTVVAYICFQLFRQPDSIPRLFRLRNYGESRTNCYVLFFVLLSLFFSVLLLQIYQADFKWFGHANIDPLGEWRAKKIIHFPVITQHYEDFIFHYFLTTPLNASIYSIIPWWLSLGLLKVSVFALLYALFRKTGTGFYLAIVFCIYMMLGTPSLLPTKYYLIFEAANPIYFTAFSGRLLGVIFLIFMIVYGACETKEDRLPRLYFILAGMGLTAIVAPDALWVVLFYFLTIVFKYYYNHSDAAKKYTTRLEDISGRSIAYGSIFVSLLLYGLHFDNWSAHLLRLFFVSLIFILLLIRVTPKILYVLRRKFAQLENRNSITQTVILTLSVGIGLVFLGNLLAMNELSKSLLAMLEEVFGRTEITLLYSSHATYGKLVLGDYRELASGSSYNWGLAQFAASYGAILSMILVSDYLFTKNNNTVSVMEYALYENFLIASASVPILLWFTDFLGVFSYFSWEKTRFLELPVYYIVFYFLFSLNSFITRPKVKIIIAVILIIYSVTPFLATERHKQIYENGLFLEQLINKVR